MTSGLRPTSSSRSIPNPALEAGIGAWLCHKEKAFVSETTSKSSRNQLSSHYGRCKMKFPEAGRGGQAQVHTGQEAGCLGIPYSTAQGPLGAGDRCVGKRQSWSGKCRLATLQVPPENGSRFTSVWSQCIPSRPVPQVTPLAAASSSPPP